MLSAGDRIGDWIVQRPLGEGGMGAVFRAHNALVPRILAAVKVLKPHALEEARERFFREVIAVDELRHPHIVRVKGFGEDSDRGLLWMAMELVEGPDLGALIHAGPTPPQRASAIVRPLLDALGHAHAVGIHHRDIKPSNVLIAADGKAKLVDFGIATQEGLTRLTRTGMVVGTPAYMPPEIFGDEAVSPAAADIYAMGQVLFELLTGAPAYPEDTALSEGQRMARMFSAKMRAEPLDPGPSCPQWLRDAVMRATHPDPAERVADVASLRDSLAPAQSSASPETTWVPTSPADAPRPAERAPVAAPTWPVSAEASEASEAASESTSSQAESTSPPPPPTRRRRGGLWLGVGAVASVVGVTALLFCAGAGVAGGWASGLFGGSGGAEPSLADSFTSDGVVIPRVEGARRVPLRAFLAPDPDGGYHDVLHGNTLADCILGEDMGGVLPLMPVVIEAAPGAPLRVGGVEVGELHGTGVVHVGLRDRLQAISELGRRSATVDCAPWALSRDDRMEAQFPGRALMLVDERLSYETVQALVASAHEGGFEELAFVVHDPDARLDGSFSASLPPSWERRQTPPIVQVHSDGFAVGVAGSAHRVTLACEQTPCASVQAWPVESLSTLLAELRPHAGDTTSVVLQPPGAAPWGLVASTLASVSRTSSDKPLFPDVLLAGPEAGSSEAVFAAPAGAGPTPIEWPFSADVAVLVPYTSEPTVERAPSEELLAALAELSGDPSDASIPAPPPRAEAADRLSALLGAGSGSASTGLEGLEGGGLGDAFGSQGGSGGLGYAGSGVGGGGIGGGGTSSGSTGSDAGGARSTTLGAKPTNPKTTAGAPKVLGALDRSLIDKVIRRHMAQIRYCYQRELTKNPALAGKLTIKFVIARDGSVSQAGVDSSTLGSPAAESCITARFRRMEFPEPKGGGIVIVSYPFVFSAG